MRWRRFNIWLTLASKIVQAEAAFYRISPLQTITNDTLPISIFGDTAAIPFIFSTPLIHSVIFLLNRCCLVQKCHFCPLCTPFDKKIFWPSLLEQNMGLAVLRVQKILSERKILPFFSLLRSYWGSKFDNIFIWFFWTQQAILIHPVSSFLSLACKDQVIMKRYNLYIYVKYQRISVSVSFKINIY